MSEKQKINILLFTKNLRLRDNESFHQIVQEDLPFLAVYIFDSEVFHQSKFGSKKCGRYRTKFLIETVQDLQRNLAQKSIPFLVKHAKTVEVFEELRQIFDIQTIFCQQEWTSEELELEQRIVQVIPQVLWKKSYSQFLIQPQFVFSVFEKTPLLFTSFRQKIEKNLFVRPEFETENICYNKAPIDIKSDRISLQVLGFDEFETDPRTAFPFNGGELQALQRLDYYFTENKLVSRYKETRNGLLGLDYSSKFSAWLANGSLSAVSIYHELKNYEQQFGANESSYWLVFELFWRDFFKYVSLQHKNEIFQKNGIGALQYPTETNPSVVELWKAGRTACDFVNANMLELKHTGWMSNRGRQNVASYFCKTLRQDWRIGAAYFEEMLIDYDVHSNYGNWMYVAGVGNDNRNRIFNTEKQSTIYDPQKKFRKLWLTQ